LKQTRTIWMIFFSLEQNCGVGFSLSKKIIIKVLQPS